MSKYTETMSNYMKQPLLENMQSNLYSFYTDETSDVTSIEQLAIYIFKKSIYFRPNPNK